MTLRTSRPGQGWRCPFDAAGCRRVRQRPDARFLAAWVVHGQPGASWLNPEEVCFSRPGGLSEGEAGCRQTALPTLRPALSRGGTLNLWQRLNVFMELSQPVRSCNHFLFFIRLLILFFLQVFQVTQPEPPGL